MKTIPQLRFDLDSLSKNCFDYLSFNSNLIELKPNYHISKHYQEFNAKANMLIERGKHEIIPPILYTLNRSEGINGWNIYYEMSEITVIPLTWNQGNMKYIKQGYWYRMMRKPRHKILHLFIKKDGTVLYKTKASFRTLCLSTFLGVTHLLGEYLTRCLLTLKQDKEWLDHLMQITTFHSNNSNINHITVGKNMYDKCSSLQEFINNVNTRDHYISADWFKGIGLKDIVETMALLSDPTIYFNNAMDYFNFINESGSDFDRPIPSIGVMRQRIIPQFQPAWENVEHANPVNSDF